MQIITNAWNRVIMRFCTDEKSDRELGIESAPYPATIRLFYWEIAMILMLVLLIALPGSLNKFVLWPFVFGTVWIHVLRSFRRETPIWNQDSLWKHVHPRKFLMLIIVGNLKYGFISFLISWCLTSLDSYITNGIVS